MAYFSFCESITSVNTEFTLYNMQFIVKSKGEESDAKKKKKKMSWNPNEDINTNAELT